MVSINNNTKEINCKIVYYGPGLGGKTTNLQVIHKKVPKTNKSEMVSLATESDRTLFFDYLPLDLGKIKGFDTKFQLYTVPGQVYYNETRKLVLRGVDGVVFVADSQRSKLQETIDSFENLQSNLRDSGLSLEKVPHVIQYNKRDFEDVVPIDELEEKVNKYNVPYFEAIAVKSNGVFTTLKSISKAVITKYNRSSGLGSSGGKFKKKSEGSSSTPPSSTSSTPPNPVNTPPAKPLSGSHVSDVDEDIQNYVKSKKNKSVVAKPAPAPEPEETTKQEVSVEKPESAFVEEDVKKPEEIETTPEETQTTPEETKTSSSTEENQTDEPGDTPPAQKLDKKSIKDAFLSTDGNDDFDYTPENPGYTGLSDELSEENASFLDVKPYTGTGEGDLPSPGKKNSDLDFDPFGESQS